MVGRGKSRTFSSISVKLGKRTTAWRVEEIRNLISTLNKESHLLSTNYKEVNHVSNQIR